MQCRTELVVRDLASGRQRVWTTPQGASVDGLQLSPDSSRLVYLLERTPSGDRLLHLLPLAGTTSVTDGQDLLIAVAGRPNDQHPATVYVIRDGQPRSVPFPDDCWQADWWPLSSQLSTDSSGTAHGPAPASRLQRS